MIEINISPKPDPRIRVSGSKSPTPNQGLSPLYFVWLLITLPIAFFVGWRIYAWVMVWYPTLYPHTGLAIMFDACLFGAPTVIWLRRISGPFKYVGVGVTSVLYCLALGMPEVFVNGPYRNVPHVLAGNLILLAAVPTIVGTMVMYFTRPRK